MKKNKEKNINKKIINKRNIIIFLIIVVLVALIFFAINNIEIVNNKNQFNQIMPEQEISEEQIRQTIISLYFYNKETGNLEKESRVIDVKILLKDPYNTIMQMLINGSENEKLESAIPINAKVEDIKLENNKLIFNLIIENNDNINQEKIINQINKTLIELLEINEIQINFN